jgi:photosynthetic reaction center cytochrome c subunit
MRSQLSLGMMAAAGLLLAACEAPPPAADQNGPRGTGMVQVYNPRSEASLRELSKPPEADPPVAAEGPPVSQLTDVYKNVKVVGDLPEGQFLRLMNAMTTWVAPKEGDNAGCAYCHNPENMADESKYQHGVARRMLQMTKLINEKWKPHVGETGVTCYTCHRGQPVPQHSWVSLVQEQRPFAGYRPEGQNQPNRHINSSSLPGDPFTVLLRDAEQIRVAGRVAEKPADIETGKPIQAAERTYALMIHMSQALGVNCTFCHNTQGFPNWSNSTPQRVVSWHGLRMIPDINATFIEPLGPNYPRERRGIGDDAAKVQCTTCHQGVNKPLYGAQMWKDYATELSAAKP